MRAVNSLCTEAQVESFLGLENSGNFAKKYWFGDSRCPAYSLLILVIFQLGFLVQQELLGNFTETLMTLLLSQYLQIDVMICCKPLEA